MMVYIFSADKRVRKIIPTDGVTDLVHDEAAATLFATINMGYGVINGEHLGFMCVDGHFRLFTVTKSENFEDNHTTIITAQDAIVRELMEMVVEEKQQLDVQLISAIEGLLQVSGTADEWTVTGVQPERQEKSRAYYTDLWTMLETYKVLYEWQIIPYYTFYGGQISGRVIELKPDVAEFRGRILTSKKDAANVYIIKTNPPITKLYVLGPATGSNDEPKNMTIKDVSWSVSGGHPANKPKGQAWIEDTAAASKYGIHTAVVQITDAEDEDDLIEKGWKHLQTVKEPTSTVEATVQDLERVRGYENQIIRLGDLVPIRLTNATMEAARVINIKRDYIRPSLTKVIIGDKEATIQSQVSTLMTNAAHTFERLTIYKNRFHEDEALIQLNAEMIQLNAEVIEMNAEEIRMNAQKIDMKAGLEEVTELGSRISAAEILIDGIEAEITLKASRAELTEVESRLSSAEIRIDGAEAAITLKAEQSTVTAMEQRLSQAEIDIDGANAQISLKASQSTVDALGERVTSAELLIDGQNSKIEAKADLILLDGYVKTTELEAEVLNVFEANIESAIAEYLSANELDVQSLLAASVNTNYLSADSITTDSLTVGGSDVATQAWVEEQGYLKSNSGTFATQSWVIDQGYAKSADVAETLTGFVMQGELDGYATESWVEDQGYLTEIPAGYATEAWVTENFSKASATYKPTVIERYGSVSGTSIPVQALNEAGTVLLTGTVDAGDVYTSGKNSVTLSAGEWQSGNTVVSASNGESVTVSLPSFSVSGGETFTNNKTTVYFNTASVNGYLASKTVDATSVYNAGYEAAAVTDLTIGSATYYTSSKVYTFPVTATSANGTTKQEYFGISATEAYDAGYSAGYAAGQAAGGGTPEITLAWTAGSGDHEYIVMAVDGDGNVLATDTSDFTFIYDEGWDAACDAIEIVNGSMSITNTQPNYMHASVRVTVEVDDVAIKSKTIAGSQYFPGLGQG